MRPKRPGQIVKFHTPLAGENPDRLFVTVEIKEDVERPRVDIIALNTGLSLVPINTVLLDDLIVVEVETSDLIGHEVTINKVDYSQARGKVVEVSDWKIMLDLTKGVNGVETNVRLTVKDEKGIKHTGTLFVN